MFHVEHKKIGEQSPLPTNQNLSRYENSKVNCADGGSRTHNL
jgi:hypothetical protein